MSAVGMVSNSGLQDGALNPHSEPSVAYSGQFGIGGVSVYISSERSTDVAFGPALHPFRNDGEERNIGIRIEWVDQLSPARGPRLFDSGSVWRLYEWENGFQFDFSAANLGEHPYKRFFIDSNFRSGTLQMSEDSFAGCGEPAYPMDYPFDELLIMHRLTQEKAIELHGSGIVRANGVGNLFVGHSGAGKSTTTRLWTEREDVEVLSDDRIIVRRDEGGCLQIPRDAAGRAGKHEVPSASSGQALRLRDRSASPTGHSAQDDKKKGMRMYGTPWHGEAMYASPNSAPLARIFILEHGHGNVLTQLSPSQAVAELFARSFVPFHRHEYVDSALEFLQEVVDAVPCYRYCFEPDERAVDRILDFRD